MKNEILTTHQTFIGKYYYENHKEDNQKILKKILELSKTEKSNNKSNVLGWQSTEDFYKYSCMNNLEKFIRMCINDYLNQVTKMCNIEGQVKSFSITDLWANICPKNSYHRRHTHPGSDISGAYYVKVPKEASKLVFKNPHCFFRFFEIGFPYTSIIPQEGLLVLFDSGLEHEVDLNKSDDLRIGISFNCQIMKT